MAGETKAKVGPIGKRVAGHLRALRGLLDMPRADVSYAAGELGLRLPAASYGAIERGERRADADELVALANVFDVTVADLFTGKCVERVAERLAATAPPMPTPDSEGDAPPFGFQDIEHQLGQAFPAPVRTVTYGNPESHTLTVPPSDSITWARGGRIFPADGR